MWSTGDEICGGSETAADKTGSEMGDLIWRILGRGEDLQLTYLLLWQESAEGVGKQSLCVT